MEIEIYELTETKVTVTVVFSTDANDWNSLQITKSALKQHLADTDEFEGIDLNHYLADNLLPVVTEYINHNLQEVA